MIRNQHILCALVLAPLFGLSLGTGCSGNVAENTGGSGGAGGAGNGGSSVSPGCPAIWEKVTNIYQDATELGSCDKVAGAEEVVESLFNFAGLTIDNNGETMTPCIDTRCDAKYVYVASNALPHYDFVQTTPNALVENAYIYRLPLTSAPVASTVQATDAKTLTGCTAAYTQYLKNPAQGTNNEPSGLCGTGYFYDDLQNGERAYYHRIPCLNTTGFVINGSPVFGPNEAQTPDPWGNPVFSWPNVAGEPYGPGQMHTGAALDLCGGHTANTMHYHGVNEACFERDAEGKPANSYVKATENWDFDAFLNADCTKESTIVGYSLDGYPIKGPCVCTERNTDGSCKVVRKARSSWVYAGLGSWGNDPNEAASLGVEGKACAADTDCCAGGGACNFQCSYAVFNDASAPGGSTAGRRCVLLDYSWCTHRFTDRTKQDTTGANYVYLDRCNGFEGPDGYAYYATMSFPFLTGCLHGEPTDSLDGANAGGMMMPGGGGMGGMGPTGGGMMPPACMPGQTSMCCGDGQCDGPETKDNCSADCK